MKIKTYHTIITMSILATICFAYFRLINTITLIDDKSQDNIEAYIHDQVEICEKWMWDEKLPQFIFDTVYNQRYYPEFSAQGGFVDLAIIQQINNKSLLLRLITGCEQELDIPSKVKISKKIRWGEKNKKDYYGFLNMRLAAFRKYQLTYTTSDLKNQLKKLKLQTCNSEGTVFYFNNTPIVNAPIREVDVDNKIIKGFVYYMGTRNTDDMAVVYSEEGDSALTKASTDEELLKEMSRILEDSFLKNWKDIISGKIEVDSIVETINRSMAMELSEKFVSHYTGPYFELKQQSYVEKVLIKEALARKKSYPLYLVKIVNGYAAIIFIEKIQ